MNYRVTHAPIWDTNNIQRGVIVADTAEQARQIFVLSGCEVLEVEELHAIEQATDLEAQYETPQADETDWFTKSDSIISRKFDPAWEIHCQEVNDTRATDYPM